MSRAILKDKVQMANEGKKEMFNLTSLQKMQIKTALKFNPIPVRMAVTKNKRNAGKNVEKNMLRKKPLTMTGWHVSYSASLEINVGFPPT